MTRNSAARSLSGALLALSAWAAFSLQDAIVKWLVADLSVPEVLLGRSLAIVAITAPFLRRGDYEAIRAPRNARAILLRSALILLAWGLYYRASRSLPLADLATYYFVGPLFVVALSAPVLGETVGLGRWLAVALGFSGVVIAANPSAGAPLAPVVMTLLAALAWAFTTLLGRSLSRAVSTPAMMAASSVFFALACAAALPFVGAWPTRFQAVSIGLLGLVGAAGQYLWFEGVRRAQASLLAPLEYTLLGYAVFWGYLFFGDWPSLRTLAGAGVIGLSGFVAMAIEMRRRRIASP